MNTDIPDSLNPLSPWIPTATLPPPGMRVLVCFAPYSSGRLWHTIAVHRPRRWEDADMVDDPADWADYDEEADRYWWPEGWYEQPVEGEQEYSISRVLCWMELPPAPKVDVTITS